MKTIWYKKYKHITLNQPGHDSSLQTVSTVHSGIYNNFQPGLMANSQNPQGHGQRRCLAFYLIYLSPDISSPADLLLHDSHCPVGMLIFQYSSQMLERNFKPQGHKLSKPQCDSNQIPERWLQPERARQIDSISSGPDGKSDAAIKTQLELRNPS